MNWWGKLIGTGIGMLGGPVGALAGAAFGHLYDEDDPTPQSEQKARILYIAYFFSCAAKVAKADGDISAAEIKATESIMESMGLDEKTCEFAKNIFRKAKVSRRSIDDDVREVGRLIGYEATVGLSFLGGLYEIVRSNGKKLNEIQIRYLLRCEERLKLRPGTIQGWIRSGYAPPQYESNPSELSLDESYDVLGLSNTASDKEVKTAYRSRAADFHPDKLKSKNLPAEFITFANEQLARINQAHEIIRKTRNLK